MSSSINFSSLDTTIVWVAISPHLVRTSHAHSAIDHYGRSCRPVGAFTCSGAGEVDRGRLDYIAPRLRAFRSHPSNVQGEDRHRRARLGTGHWASARYRPAG